MGIPKESDDGGKRSRKEENKSRGKTREGKNKDYALRTRELGKKKWGKEDLGGSGKEFKATRLFWYHSLILEPSSSHHPAKPQRTGIKHASSGLRILTHYSLLGDTGQIT